MTDKNKDKEMTVFAILRDGVLVEPYERTYRYELGTIPPAIDGPDAVLFSTLEKAQNAFRRRMYQLGQFCLQQYVKGEPCNSAHQEHITYISFFNISDMRLYEYLLKCLHSCNTEIVFALAPSERATCVDCMRADAGIITVTANNDGFIPYNDLEENDLQDSDATVKNEYGVAYLDPCLLASNALEMLQDIYYKEEYNKTNGEIMDKDAFLNDFTDRCAPLMIMQTTGCSYHTSITPIYAPASAPEYERDDSSYKQPVDSLLTILAERNKCNVDRM